MKKITVLQWTMLASIAILSVVWLCACGTLIPKESSQKQVADATTKISQAQHEKTDFTAKYYPPPNPYTFAPQAVHVPQPSLPAIKTTTDPKTGVTTTEIAPVPPQAEPAPAPNTFYAQPSEIHASTESGGASNAGEQMSASSFDITSIPLFVKIIGLAVGIGLISAVVIIVLKKIRQGAAGPAAAAGLRVGETAITAVLNGVEAKLPHVTDEAAREHLLAVQKDLEKARGKVTGPAMPPK